MEYLFVVFISIVLAIIIDQFDSRIALTLLIIILSLLCGLRGPEVGVDTENYIRYFTDLESIGIGYGSEWGFSLISYILMSFFHFAHIPLLFFGIITNVLILLRLWDYRDKSSFWLMILIYLVFFYLYTFVLVRQCLAMSLIFWGSRYIDKQRIGLYLLINILAISVHTTSIICVLLIILNGSRNKIQKIRLTFLGIITFLIILGLGIMDSKIDKYKSYSDLQNSSFQIMTVSELFVYFSVLIFSRQMFKVKFAVSKTGQYFGINKSLCEIYGFGLLLFSMGMFITYTNRIGMYFLLFEMPFWAQLSRARKNKMKYILPILIIVTVKLFYICISDDVVSNYSTFLGLI